MSEMVERVARAMCEAADDNWDWSVFYVVDANDTAETGRDVYRNMARAAIEAMMEHTPAMDSAGYDAYPDSAIRTGIDHLDIYRAMIQAALKESDDDRS